MNIEEEHEKGEKVYFFHGRQFDEFGKVELLQIRKQSKARNERAEH